eukprot:GSChrysophyteH1.ASY1.ANO1.2875.1 assembled CDS
MRPRECLVQSEPKPSPDPPFSLLVTLRASPYQGLQHRQHLHQRPERERLLNHLGHH